MDAALLRPGRFDRIIEIPLPDIEGREAIFRVHSGKMPKAKEVDDRKLASMTEGFSGAEIKSAVLEAGISAISDNRKSVNKDDFILAIKKVQENRNTSSDSNSEGIYT